MKIQTKVSLAILPIILLPIIVLSFWSIKVAKKGIEKAAGQHMETVLDTYVSDKVTGLHNLLVKNLLDKEESYVRQYQLQAVRSAKEVNLSEAGRIFVLNTSGRLVFTTAGKNPRTIQPQWEQLAGSLVKRLKMKTSGQIKGPDKGYFYAAHYFKPWEWTIFYVTSDEEVYQAQRSIRKATAIITSLCAAAAALLIFLFSRNLLVKPIKIINAAAASITGGERVAKINVHSRDELGRLARSMEEMSEAIAIHRAEQEAWQEQLEQKVSEQTEHLRKEIVERKRIEQALRKSEAVLKSIFQAAPVGLGFVKDRVLGWTNEQLTKITGYASDELTGRNVRMLYESAAEYERIGKEKYADVKKFGTSSIETHFRRKDGRIIDISLSLSMLVPGDFAAGLVFAALDITEQTQAQEKIKRQSEFLRNAIESLTHPFYVINADDYTIKLANSAAGLGTISDASTCHALTHHRSTPCDGTEHCCPLQEVKKTGQPVLTEHIHHDEQGRKRHMEVHGYPIFDDQGNVVQMIEYALDITERKKAQAEREALIAELEAKNMELEQFTYTVSHDLKSPLITINGFIGLLAKDVTAGDTQRIKADIARIHDATDKMGRLLEELLELSRIGRVVNPPEQVLFGELAHEAVELTAGRLTEANIKVEIASGLPAVFGDRSRIRELIENLVGNAAKFMGDQSNPRIEIGARLNDRETIFYVRDNGVGIDPKYHRKVFKLFDKLDPKSNGTGVGLAIVKRIVEVHAGRIWVESEGMGKGSTFCFTLPES